MREFNAVVLGAGGVGKSALVVRFTQDQFLDTYDPTIEEAYSKTWTVDDELVQLDVLDTAGAEQFTAITELYIKAATGFVLVFSLIQEASLKEVSNLRTQIARVKGVSEADVPLVVVGTKSDLVYEREVQPETLKELSYQWTVPFYETSAKKNSHVQEAFDDLVRQMRTQETRQLLDHRKRVKRPKRKPKTCVVM
ncbi:rap 1A [Sistotremastrum niveocremeum HHB9708]|uniref:Rap 1A n=2 Tax=Sistotremastraceae TaxID=3402574 RepID=A0A164TRF5_9AGAM|nr:rap 1A [Sistotremastrum niveocremeum HHB9708]KZT42243.1 rap 1A [Sistotremastrum suecicum HHB10207 ss-3]